MLSKYEFTPFRGKIIVVVGRYISECNVMNLPLILINLFEFSNLLIYFLPSWGKKFFLPSLVYGEQPSWGK